MKSVKTRFAPGSEGTNPWPWMKNENVEVSFAPMSVVTVGAGLPLMHAPWAFVRQTKTAMGKLPLRGLTVIDRVTPTFVVATAKAAAPVLPWMSTVRFGVVVAASAMMSATGV